MKEKPILLSGEMVRAILDNRKTQTRRAVNRVQRIGRVTEFQRSDTPGYDWIMRDERMMWNDISHADLLSRCPYGQPGDRLWVRETYRHCGNISTGGWCFEMVGYAADGASGRCGEWMTLSAMPRREWWNTGKEPWSPSIFMPRRYSRLTLEVTGIRVERVQDITESDARAEGIIDGGCLSCGNPEPCGCEDPRPDARDGFIGLWDDIYAKRGSGWEVNPFVWVVEFKVVS
jgi:hypothetical protein